MLKFKVVRWKNFLSTGDDFIEVPLDTDQITLITGRNGSGKSTMIEAISFSLFGKPYRNINKPQLVNTINKKGTVTEIEFETNSRHYKIVRGIKPTIFEIWENGKLIDQSSKSKDYQNFLERNILKLDHKSFHQIVILGASSFVPFMQLPAAVRREVIENLLDIKIFSHMNTILKERVTKSKAGILQVDQQIEMIENNIDTHKVYYQKLVRIKEEATQQNENEIRDIEDQIAAIKQKKFSVRKMIENELNEDTLTSPNDLQKKAKKLSKKRDDFWAIKSQLKSRVKDVVSTAKFFSENSQCPTCDQDIHDKVRKVKLEESESKAKEINRAISEAQNHLDSIEADLAESDKKIKRIMSLDRESEEYGREIDSLLARKDTILKRIAKADSSVDDDIKQAKDIEKELAESLTELKENRLSLLEDHQYIEASVNMMKDNGIKTKIVAEYLPVINTLVNKYLQTMDFFVSFHLNSSFTEEIRSRHLDTFSYASFSEGEKQKIDISLLFAWRQIARMKNSASTNLLILDEVGDSSLDSVGLDALINILNTAEKNTNVFVISHRENQLDGMIDAKITFSKEKNFTKTQFS